MRTGDLGFFRDGELFVTGRVKDVIIIRGRNHYPQDIEQSAEEAHPAVLPGAAFALELTDGGEQLVVVHQLDRQYRGADYQQIVQAIRRAIVEQHELDPYAIVLIRQTSLPITSSGKVQRNLCREQYLAGELKVVHSWTNPAMRRGAEGKSSGHVDVQIHGEGVSCSRNGDAAVAASSSQRMASNGTIASQRRPRREPASVELDRAAERIEAWLLEWLVARLGLDAADVSRDRPFAEFGVDSLTAVELSQELEDAIQSAAAADRGLELSDAGGACPLPGRAIAGRRRTSRRTADGRSYEWRLRFRLLPTRPSWPRSWPRSKRSRTRKRRSCWRKGSKI